MPTLGDIWFVLVGVLILVYGLLDGFDLGAGILMPFVGRSERERALVRRTFAAVWDGNEVWLLTAGGALFAAFPVVYATVFSGLYLALVLLLVALMARAVALEFRDQIDDGRWRAGWDVALFAGSAVPPLLLGVAVGNIVRGLPLAEDGLYHGGLIGLLTPFPILVGLLVVAFVVTHGALWLVAKTDGIVAIRARRAAAVGVAAEVVLWLAVTILASSQAGAHWSAFGTPLAWLAPACAAVGFVAIPLALRASRELLALGASALSLVGLVATLGVGLYPNLVPALDAPSRSISIATAASSDLTLTVMLVIALIGVPLVLAYTAFVYRRLWGKVSALDDGYGH